MEIEYQIHYSEMIFLQCCYQDKNAPSFLVALNFSGQCSRRWNRFSKFVVVVDVVVVVVVVLGVGGGGGWFAEYMCSKRNTANSRPVARIV